MNHIHCSEDHTLQQEDGTYQICSRNEGKEWIEEGLQAIAEAQGKTFTCIKNLCNNHQNAHRMNHLEKWEEAKKRVQESNEAKIIHLFK